MSRLNNVERVQDISYVAANMSINEW